MAVKVNTFTFKCGEKWADQAKQPQPLAKLYTWLRIRFGNNEFAVDKCCAQWNQSFIILIVSGYYNLTCHSSTVFSHSRSFAIRIIQLKMPCSFPFDPFDEGVFSSEIPMAKHFDCYVNCEQREKFPPHKCARNFFVCNWNDQTWH